MKNLTILFILVLIHQHAVSQGISDVGVIWEKEGTMPLHSQSTTTRGTTTLKNGNYCMLDYSYREYVMTAPSEIYLTEFTETGNLVRQQTIHIPVEGAGRTFMTNPTIIERSDGKLLMMIEYQHGGAAFANNRPIARLILTPDPTAGYGGGQGWTYIFDYPDLDFIGHSGYQYLRVMRALSMEQVEPNLIAVAVSIIANDNSFFGGLLYVDNDGNPAVGTRWTTRNATLQPLVKDNAATAVKLEGGRAVVMTQGGHIAMADDVYGSNMKALGSIGGACVGCKNLLYGVDYFGANIDNTGYIGIGRTAVQVPPTYLDGIFQVTGWQWNNNKQILTTPNPYFQRDNLKMVGYYIRLTNKTILSIANINCTAGPSAICPPTSYIAQFDIENTGLNLTIGNELSSSYNQSLRTRSSLLDGIMTGGVNNTRNRTVFGKVSMCKNYAVTALNNITIYSGQPVPTQNFTATGAFATSTESYKWRAILKKGQLGGIYAGKIVGDELTNGTSTTINSLNFINSSYTDAIVEIEYTATQYYGNPQMHCSSISTFDVRVKSPIDVVAMPHIDPKTNKVNLVFKNIGGTAIIAPFHITLYKDTFDNATRLVYSYNQVISVNETIQIEIDASSLGPVSKYIVAINDDGIGGYSQDSNLIYEID